MTHRHRASLLPILPALVLVMIAETAPAAPPAHKAPRPKLDYRIELSTAVKGFDGKTCWVHTRPGAIPPGTPGNPGKKPIVL
ncbi:MAG TPA: hypothetical protein DER64_15130, partial [Planctomycetaceae bacterium]|nr:hypothetical protein [Planctomycetaceae bacterium]